MEGREVDAWLVKGNDGRAGLMAQGFARAQRDIRKGYRTLRRGGHIGGIRHCERFRRAGFGAGKDEVEHSVLGRAGVGYLRLGAGLACGHLADGHQRTRA